MLCCCPGIAMAAMLAALAQQWPWLQRQAGTRSWRARMRFAREVVMVPKQASLPERKERYFCVASACSSNGGVSEGIHTIEKTDPQQ